jgi:hypothetical protein
MEIEEIKRELQERQRSHPEEREEEKLEQPCTIKNGEQKLSLEFTTEEESEIQQHKDQINKLRKKIESMYYQVTQITMDKRPRLQKLQNMSKMKVIMKAANEAMGEIVDEKDLSITELNHLINAAAMVITEEMNGIGEYKLQTQRSKTPPWVRRIQGSVHKFSPRARSLGYLDHGSVNA